MKRVNVELDTNIDLDKITKSILDKYRNDKFFIKTYQELKEENKKIDLIPVLDVVESKRKCEGCYGLSYCKQKVRGHYLWFSDFDYVQRKCEYLQKKEEVEAKFSNLVYSTFNFSKALPTIDQITISQDRVEMIKHLGQLLDGECDKGLFLSGAPGVGKTFVIETLLNSYLDKGYRVAYILLNDLFNELRNNYFSNDKDDKQTFNRIMNRLKNVDILIIDDIGSERVDTINRDEILFPLLDYRMKNNKLTHFTSNYLISELEEHYKETSKLSEPTKAKRIVERIRVLAQEFVLVGESSKRQ
ncbi:MAG: ATP-binding protein [Erysipelotrichales bacterium]